MSVLICPSTTHKPRSREDVDSQQVSILLHTSSIPIQPRPKAWYESGTARRRSGQDAWSRSPGFWSSPSQALVGWQGRRTPQGPPLAYAPTLDTGKWSPSMKIRYWLIYYGTGSVEGGTGRYLVRKRQYWFIHDGAGSVRGSSCWYMVAMDQYKAVRVDP